MKKLQISSYKLQVTNNKPPRPSGTPPFKRRGIIPFSFLLFSFFLFPFSASAQSLLDVYKKGVVKLVPDTEYAKDNNWGKVFESYYDTLYQKHIGARKSLIITPNGSVVVSHAYRNYYSQFDASGKFVKEFGITDKSGKQFKKIQAIEGIMNNTFFTGLDNMGKMLCFDLNGNYEKTLTLNYSTNGIIPMKNNKIAVVGWVLWKEKIRDFVAIVDFQTNEQKVIWEQFTKRNDDGNNNALFNYSYRFETGGMVNITTMPYSSNTGISSPPQIAFVNDRLIVALPHTGEIIQYDINGNQKSKEKIGWGNHSLSVEEQKEIQRKAIENWSNEKIWMPDGASQEEYKKARETLIKQMKADLNKITTPITIPIFSNIIKDSDGNLLFFEMPEKEGGNKFNVWVYQNGGQFVCQSSFVCDDYNLVITPSKMVFHKGYIYALQTLKNAKGNPLRLVRFKVGN